MPRVADLSRVREALVQALALVDHLQGAGGRRLDQGITDLLADMPDGLSGTTITRLLRRRRGDVRGVLRLMEKAGTITRVDARWRLVD